jgi:purine-binding chemotaxis protein CheW
VADPRPPPADLVDFGALQRRLDEAEEHLAGDVTGEARRGEILAERARAIAGSRAVVRVDGVAVVAFSVGGERYAVEVEAVSQVLEARGLQPLIASPPWLLGAMVARTRIVPVLDLRQLLGLGGGGMSDLSRVVVVEHQGDAFGLAVEALEGRLEVPRASLTPAAGGPFVWVAPDRLALLDLSRLASDAGQGA